MSYLEKVKFLERRSLCVALIFFLFCILGGGISRGEGTPSSTSDHEEDVRLEEIEKELEKVVSGATAPGASLPKKNAQGIVRKKGVPSSKDSQLDPGVQPGEIKKVNPQKDVAPEQKETPEEVQDSEEQIQASSEERPSEYAVLENITWETAEKKIILRLWISGQATPEVNMIRDQFSLKMRLRPQGLATRMPRTLSSVPLGVQSFSILETPKLAQTWGLEAPYYAVDEIQAVFSMPVQYSLSQEPGLLKVTFSLPRKVEPKKVEPLPPPVETIESFQKEALGSPETTLGSNYQSQIQFEDKILYGGAQKPPSIEDLYKKERESAGYRPAGGLPDNVQPIFEARHPSFGSAEYFKKYIHGSISQKFDFTTDYNGGTTSAFGENPSTQGEPGVGGGSGKDIGTILWTPAIALLFYHPGTFDVSTGYSNSRDFPTTHNNFMYGLKRQAISVGIGHYPRKRYAFAMQNNLGITGGTTRQKVNGKWVKTATQQGYQLNNSFGLNYRLSQRLMWGGSLGISPKWSETKTTGVRNQTVIGGMNTYFAYQMTPRVRWLLGTAFNHIFREPNNNSGSTGGLPTIITKGDSAQSVYLNATYTYSEKLTLTGGFTESIIDWDIVKIGGAAGITYRGTHHDSLSFQYANSVIQNNTAMILARTVNTANGFGISLQRVESLGLTYNRKFDRGKTEGTVGVNYTKNSPLSGIFYGGTEGVSTVNYDVQFTASIRRSILNGRAFLGLLYTYDWAPNVMRNYITGERDLTSDTSQNIIANMSYDF